jgi:hypothetical protein
MHPGLVLAVLGMHQGKQLSISQRAVEQHLGNVSTDHQARSDFNRLHVYGPIAS